MKIKLFKFDFKPEKDFYGLHIVSDGKNPHYFIELVKEDGEDFVLYDYDLSCKAQVPLKEFLDENPNLLWSDTITF